MSDVKWTSEQQTAINARGSSLLISAAAGSGKTAVLVERLVKRIVEEKRDITDFLIITYTKAAASELRKKISSALYDEMARRPGDRHIRRQLALCGSARISTVHSFCSWMLKNYGDMEAAISFRILDDAEGELILREVLSELIEEKYEEKSESFLALAKYMSDGRGDKLLFSSVLELFKKSRSHPYPEIWIEKAAAAYNTQNITNIADTIWGRDMLLRVTEIIGAAAKTILILTADVDRDAELSALYCDSLLEARAAIEKCLSDDWDTLFKNTSEFKLGGLPSSKGIADKTVPKRIAGIFGLIRKDMKAIPEKLMQADSETLLSEIKALYPIVRELASLASELLGRFEKEKLRRGVLDYSDLEHLSIKLLVSSYDEETDVVVPSDIGREISKDFCEILLDEFQDSNIIQDIIFRAVSQNEKNIVMVGDVKQSIYGFRLADPSIFVKKYKSFKRFEEADDNEPRCISLSKNFRSRKEILHTANGIFSRIMTEKLGGVDYNEEHYLVERDGIPSREGMESEFYLLDVNRGEEKGIEAEARFTALKISELVKNGFKVSDKNGELRPCRYSDFALLLRSTATSAPYYEREFSRLGIPFISPKTRGLLEKSEVNSVISLLSVVDNPTSDIPLIAALRSPMFAFSADDLCEIRRESGECFIYSMELLAKKQTPTAEKCRSFLTLLRSLRSLARGKSASELIWEIYNRTNALGMFGAMSFGQERQENLLEFYRSAEAFEALGYSGLYKFISHIANLSENGGDISAPRTYSEDAVTIMTLHKSKGLEFPIVFLGTAIRSFNLEDIKNPVLIHPELGIGLKFRDDKNAIECTTLMREAIRYRIMDELKSEEMRLLYVALTRAREKMFITASRENAAKKLLDVCSENPYRSLDATNLVRRNDAMLWFLLPLLRTDTGREIFAYANVETFETESLLGLRAYVLHSDEIPYGDEISAPDAKTNETEVSEWAIPDFSYEHTAATRAPSKLTATGLGAISLTERKARRKRLPRPGFIREKELSPSERGVALHMAMQFVDFSRCETSDGARLELERLCEQKFLTKAQAEAVSPDHISAFLSSDIGRDMKRAEHVEREFKFSVLLPAKELIGQEELDDEEILLQGVIDMYFETDDGITIVDFKTDRFRPEGDTLRKYSAQLDAYSRALFEMTGKRASRRVLYLVQYGEAIEV